jgi:hypothetical protein
MKRIILVIVIILLSIPIYSCDEETFPPDFTKENKVIEKITDSDDISRYKVVFEVNDSRYTYVRYFYAPYSFAKMGDIVSHQNGVIKVIGNKNNE